MRDNIYCIMHRVTLEKVSCTEHLNTPNVSWHWDDISLYDIVKDLLDRKRYVACKELPSHPQSKLNHYLQRKSHKVWHATEAILCLHSNNTFIAIWKVSKFTQNLLQLQAARIRSLTFVRKTINSFEWEMHKRLHSMSTQCTNTLP